MRRCLANIVLAALGAGVFSTSAQSAEAITLSVGGYTNQYFFVADQDEAAGENYNAAGLFSDTRVEFQGRTILDNGIVIRAYARLLAEAGVQRNSDEVYIEAVTSLGRIRAGEKSGVNTSTIGDPVPQAFLSVYDEVVGDALVPRTGVVLRDAFTFRRFTGNSLGLTYQSPQIYGFTVGVSYHPSPTSGEGPINNTLVPNNAVDVTAGYNGYFSGGSYRLAAGYFRSSANASGINGYEAWNVSAGLTYGGWEFAGAYMDALPSTGGRETAWTVGAFYGIGPFQLSADFRSAKKKTALPALIDERIDRATLQTAYKVSPGIMLGLAGFYAEQEDSFGVSWNGGGALGGVTVEF